MRKFSVYATLLLVLVNVNVFAKIKQEHETSTSFSNENVHIKLLGSSNLLGVAYEYRLPFKDGLFGIQAGLNYGFQKTLSSGGTVHFLGISASKDAYGNQLPDLNMIGLTTGGNVLLGKGKNYFEGGLYITHYYTDVKTLSNLSSNSSHWGSYISLDLGYRYANPGRHFCFTTGLSFNALGPGNQVFKRWETIGIYPYFSFGYFL